MFLEGWVNVVSMLPPALLAPLGALRGLLWRRAELHAEVIALRHQLLVLERQRTGRRVHFRTVDRILWAALSRCWPGWRQALVLVRPATVIRWHRQGFRLYWRWKSRSRSPGRPTIEAEIRDLILEMHRANPTWGASLGELLRLGFTVAQSTVSKYLTRPDWPTPISAEVRFVTARGFALGTIARAPRQAAVG